MNNASNHEGTQRHGMSEGMEERARIRRVFEGRPRCRVPSGAERFLLKERLENWSQHLPHWVLQEAVDVLDVGVGFGDSADEIQAAGIELRSLVGIDLVPSRLMVAKDRVDGVLESDASSLPFLDGAFDCVLMWTVMSSILDSDMRNQVAREAQRVLRPRGVILWYDFVWNPTNRHVRGVGRSEVRELFPSWEIHLSRVAPAKPLLDGLARLGSLERGPGAWMARGMERFSWLRTHLMGTIEKG